MSKDYLMVTIDGKDQILNDVLVDLPHYKGSFLGVVDGVIYKFNPDECEDFIRDYSNDTYHQTFHHNMDVEGFHNFIYQTGSIVNRID